MPGISRFDLQRETRDSRLARELGAGVAYEAGCLVTIQPGLCLQVGYGSKLNYKVTVASSPCFHLPGIHVGHKFLTHGQLCQGVLEKQPQCGPLGIPQRFVSFGWPRESPNIGERGHARQPVYVYDARGGGEYSTMLGARSTSIRL